MEKSVESRLYSSLTANFGFRPTEDQLVALRKLSHYCISAEKDHLFLLKGYAGTGKTSLINSLVKSLPEFALKVILMAPTGRAAKVMSSYSGQQASTIHRGIYRPNLNPQGGMNFTLRENKARNTLFIIDEASMIQDDSPEFKTATGGLLQDLLNFVSQGKNCKLLLVGDVAQLPPVGMEVSPALDLNYLKQAYQLQVEQLELTSVMRQKTDSGILDNATALRDMQFSEIFEIPHFELSDDFIRLTEGFEIEDALQDSFREAGREGTALIVRSNKRAALYNQQIRHRILWQEEEISTGDYLMVVKNNYYWLAENEQSSFIANGDIIELLEIYEYVNLYEKRYARVKVRMVDYAHIPPFETVILLDVLDLPAASLSWEESKGLYHKIMEDYQDIPQTYLRHRKVQANPYYNALQVKFSYAITCHKAQGGQWENVFIEEPWLPEGKVDLDYLRWLYTALTRASSKVYLINFKDEYFR